MTSPDRTAHGGVVTEATCEDLTTLSSGGTADQGARDGGRDQIRRHSATELQYLTVLSW